MSIDMNNLPADIQALIQEAVAAEMRKNQPAPPRELTPGEVARLVHKQATTAHKSDRSTPSSDMAVHDATLALLSLLVDAVYPETAEEKAAREESTAGKGGSSAASSGGEPRVITVSSGR